ncbi:MAG: alpha-galactosidase [Clostridia bacterium]|nr:alpha-galactosidase [Clostridia bacterium]
MIKEKTGVYMIDINRLPDRMTIDEEETGASDAVVSFERLGNMTFVKLDAKESRVKFIKLRWNGRTDGEVRILGDAWERAYGNLEWRGFDPERFMPWYFFANQGDTTRAYGVMTLPSAMASWEYDDSGITLLLDVRSGAAGVELCGRTLDVCTVCSVKYEGLDPFDAAHLFCRFMCPLPLLPEKPLYGGNNWYYAYGDSSYEEIISDASLQAKLAKGLENRPFMVIDDGWQINSCAGPWFPNEKYGDMKKVADEFKKMDVRPGIWVRYLRDESGDIPAEWRLNKDGRDETTPDFLKCYLDPSLPEVLEHIKKITHRIVCEWGFELIKHDFSTFDIFDTWGVNRGMTICSGKWAFHDRSKTSAEIVKNFYKVILDATEGKAMILGCNCITHLAAGLVHANRTGDDTSGVQWERTRKMGVNTLVFRDCQNNAFYAADADCVGIIPGNIDLSLNMQWARLLAASASPFFISCADGNLTGEAFEEMKKLYEQVSKGRGKMKPLDWQYSRVPSKFIIDGKETAFNWYED